MDEYSKALKKALQQFDNGNAVEGHAISIN